MKTSYTLLLAFCLSTAAPAQIYIRGNLCADFAIGRPATYVFSDHPQHMLATTEFRAQFGGGAFAQAELGLRFKKTEVGFTYAMHGGSSAVYIDTVFSARGDTVLTSRSAWFSSLSRGGLMVTYHFTEKKFSPLVFAGVHGLIRPRFTLAYKSDTLEHPNVPMKRYSQVFEIYGSGSGLGVSVGGGISFSADPDLRCIIKAGYTFQKWTPAQFVYSRFIQNGIETLNYDKLPAQTVDLSTVFITFGGTYYFGREEENRPVAPAMN